MQFDPQHFVSTLEEPVLGGANDADEWKGDSALPILAQVVESNN